MLEKTDANTLRDVPLFKNIHEDELDFFQSKFSFLKFIQDDIILNGSAFEQKTCYFLRTGKVRVVRTVPNNNEVSYYDLEAPLGFGFEHLFPDDVAGNLEDKAIVSAISNVELFSIHHEYMEELLKDERILLNFAQYLLSVHRKLLSPPTERLCNFRKSA